MWCKIGLIVDRRLKYEYMKIEGLEKIKYIVQMNNISHTHTVCIASDWILVCGRLSYIVYSSTLFDCHHFFRFTFSTLANINRFFDDFSFVMRPLPQQWIDNSRLHINEILNWKFFSSESVEKVTKKIKQGKVEEKNRLRFIAIGLIQPIRFS